MARRCLFLATAMLLAGFPGGSAAQTLDAFRADQIARLQDYVLDAIQPSGLVRDSLVLDPSRSNFHPATPDAAGFALLSLAAFDHLGTLPDAGQRVVDILRAHTGAAPGVTPERSADGHFIHFMDLVDGSDPPGWDDSYSPISSALVTAGAQFAARHFEMSGSPLAGQIRSLSDQLTESIDFDAAIHPSLDGRVYLDMTAAGGGAGGTLRPWNEYQLAVSLALRQTGNNDRAVAVRRHWLSAEAAPKIAFGPFLTLTDSPSRYASGFWVQQAHFFNGDFRLDEAFQSYFENQQIADRLYSRAFLDEEYRYGLTAGVSPDGYHADRIEDHPGEVFSPEAVAAWGDLDALMRFAEDQPPGSDPRYRYGLVRVSDEQPGWIPGDAGLVDHLFLLFGLVESLAPDFFDQRVFQPLPEGDFNFDGRVDAADYVVYRHTFGSSTQLAADANLDGTVSPADLAVWAANYGHGVTPDGGQALIPEPATVALATAAVVALVGRRRHEASSSR